MRKLNKHYAKIGCALAGMLLLSTNLSAQLKVDVMDPVQNKTILSPFKQGFAMVQEGNNRYYINTKGEKFRPLSNSVLGDPYTIERYEEEKEAGRKALPSQKVPFEQDGKQGMLSPTGELIIPAAYNFIGTQHKQFWELHQNGKKTYYLPDGSILPLFEDIGYLDGEYFDVKQNGKWHLYSKSKSKIVTKNAYDGFDYCGGCSVGAPYVYAKKDGKWGVISWDEKVLVPFSFEHEHRFMRNDNWVASFSQNGKKVIVHIPTQQVFDAESRETQLISGMLVTKKDGLFGAYDREGKLAVPFAYDELTEPNANSYLGYYGPYLIAKKQQKTGVVRADGSIVLPIEYDEVFVYDDFFVAKKEGQTYLLRNGETAPLLVLEHAEISHANSHFYSSGSDGLSIFQVKQKAYYGLYFAENNRFYEPSFYDILLRRNKFMEKGEVIEADRQGLKTLFDVHGDQVLPFEVQEYKTFDARDKALLAFKAKGKWGLYDMEQGKEVIPAGYDAYFRLLEHAQQVVIRAFADGFTGIDLYDLQGNKFNDVPLDKVDRIDNRYYLVEENDNGKKQYAVFDTESKTMEPLKYPFVAALRGTSDLLMVSHNGHDGKLYDFKHRKELERWYNVLVFPTKPDAPENTKHWLFHGFENGYGKVLSEQGIGFIDETGKIVVPPKYMKARFVGKDHLLVSEDKHIAGGLMMSYFIDIKGKRVFPADYFVDDMLYHNLDHANPGDKVVLLRTDSDHRSLLFGLGDLNTGKILIPAEYDELQISTVDSSYVLLLKDPTENSTSRRRSAQKFGVANTDGKILFEPQFDDVHQPRVGGHAQDRNPEPFFPLLVNKDGKWRYLNEDGSYLPIEGDRINRY